MVELLALSGSLQGSSSNTEMLRAAAGGLPQKTTLTVFEGIGSVPLFDPRLDQDPGPVETEALRAAVAGCDGLLIATPEYAHGMPGLLKNALDWLVTSGELSGKPVAVLSASPTPTGGIRALIMLTTTLLAHGSEVVAMLPIAAVRNKLDSSGSLADAATRRRIAETVAALCEVAEVRARK